MRPRGENCRAIPKPRCQPDPFGLTSSWFGLEPGRKLDASPRLAFTLYAIMSKSISVKRKKTGRPATGTEPLYGVRISDELMGRIQKWASENSASRSEAIRRLVELGLKKGK